MSIINDALKKTQNLLKRNDTDQAKTGTPPTPPETPPSTVSNIYDKMYKDRMQVQKPIAGPPPPVNAKAQAAKRKEIESIKQSSTGKLLFILVILMIATAVYYTVFNKSPQVQQALQSIQKFQRSAMPSKSTTRRPKIAPAPKRIYTEGEIVLNGTMVSGINRAALINDVIYELGETAMGKKITNITDNSVELMNEDGTTLLLKVRQLE